MENNQEEEKGLIYFSLIALWLDNLRKVKFPIKFNRRIMPIRARLGHEKAYERLLRKVVSASRKAGAKDLNRTQKNRAISLIVTEALKGFSKILNVTQVSHTKRWIDSVKRATNIDISFILKPKPRTLMSQIVRSNTSLITSLSSETIQKVEVAIEHAKRNKWTQKQLAESLVKIGKIGNNRAQLIAVDQINKINADFNRLRMVQAGIKGYIWRGRLDERERKLHKDLEGNKYKWNEKTGAESGAKPGEPIRCRCVAEADLRA